MQPIEQTFIDMEAANREMMEKRFRGEKLSKDDQAVLKEKMKAIHLASAEVAIEDIAGLLEKYEIGLGMAYIEPNYDRINYAFAWIEKRDREAEGKTEDDEDGDF